MRWLRTLTLLSALLFPGAALADTLNADEWPVFKTGDDLLADCGSEDPFERGVCAGYVMAIADALRGLGSRVDGLEACFRGGETIERFLEVVTAFMTENESGRAIRADGLVAYALSLEMPCER